MEIKTENTVAEPVMLKPEKNDKYDFRYEREIFLTLHYNTSLLFTVMMA